GARRPARERGRATALRIEPNARHSRVARGDRHARSRSRRSRRACVPQSVCESASDRTRCDPRAVAARMAGQSAGLNTIGKNLEEDMSTDEREVERALTEQVVASFANTEDERLRTLMQSLIRHMHAFVREVEPTEAEWMSAIRFLTATGKMCDDLVRQEFILLSDTLGVSM